MTKSSENIEKLSVYSSLSSDSSELSSDINLACLQQHMQMQGDLGKGRINVDLANDPDILKYLIDENGKDDDEPIILVDLSLPDSINNNAMAQPNQREMTVTPDGSASSFLIANDNNTKQKAQPAVHQHPNRDAKLKAQPRTSSIKAVLQAALWT